MLTPREQAYIVRGAVTTLAGGVSFALTNIWIQDTFEQFALSVNVGGFVLFLQLLSDVEKRLSDIEKVQAARAAGFGSVAELIDQVAALDGGTPPLVRDFLNDQAEDLAAQAAAFGIGAVEYEGEDRAGLLGFTRRLTRTLDAVSVQGVDTLQFWTGELGRRYLDLQQEAIHERNVQVRRLFVFSRLPSAGLDDAMRTVMSNQAARKIVVRVLMPQQVARMQPSGLRDFMVFDGSVGYETTPVPAPGPDEGMILKVQFHSRPAYVADLTRRFEALWGAAQPLAGSSAP